MEIFVIILFWVFILWLLVRGWISYAEIKKQEQINAYNKLQAQIKYEKELEEKARLEADRQRREKEENEKQEKLKLEKQRKITLEIERKKLEEKLGLKWRSDWQRFQEIVQKNNITTLYHFTDIANVNSIKANGGLYSWHYCEQNGISIAKAGGDYTSRSLDVRYNLQDYVRLCFTKNHPMMFVAQKDGRIFNPIILEIHINVIYLHGTMFSDMNATRTGHSQGSTIEDFKRIKFNIVKRVNHFDLSDNDKPYYQAEVMVKTFIPIQFILNINQF